MKNCPEYDRAWKEADDLVQHLQVSLGFAIMDDTAAIRVDAAATRAIVERLLQQAGSAGRLSLEQDQARETEMSRMTEELDQIGRAHV